jgi:hypothetical protein
MINDLSGPKRPCAGRIIARAYHDCESADEGLVVDAKVHLVEWNLGRAVFAFAEAADGH